MSDPRDTRSRRGIWLAMGNALLACAALVLAADKLAASAECRRYYSDLIREELELLAQRGAP